VIDMRLRTHSLSAAFLSPDEAPAPAGRLRPLGEGRRFWRLRVGRPPASAQILDLFANYRQGDGDFGVRVGRRG
jgi:hypothetical protein